MLPKLNPNPNEPVAFQNTTFTLDGVARYICNTLTPQEALKNSQFDAVVIGSGMYGAYCAAKLYRLSQQMGKQLRVLVLEAGPFLLTEHIQNLSHLGFGIYNLVKDTPWVGNVSFSDHASCVGGKSIFWGGWSPRLTEADLALWPAEVRDYLNTNYPRVELEMGVTPTTDFINGDLYQALKEKVSDVIATVPNLDSWQSPPIAVQGEPPASGLFSFDKFSSLPLLIDAIREDADASGGDDANRKLFLVPRARAIELRTTEGQVNQIVLSVGGTKDEGGVEQILDLQPNCAVVLALGAIESTRLALESFPTGTTPATERMGRNLMSHLRTDTVVRIKRSAFSSSLPDRLETAALHVEGSTPEGRFHLQLTAAAGQSTNSDELLYRMIPDLDLLEPLLEMQQSDWVTMTIRGIGEMTGAPTMPIHSNTNSWMDLSPHEFDRFGKRKAYVSLTATPEDQALWNAMDIAAIDLAKKLANNEPNDIEIVSVSRQSLGSSYHESGTLWMGDDPSQSITDTNGRFHHIANAYCVDQAIFPTVGSANPVLTGIVLARKVAEAIVAQAGNG